MNREIIDGVDKALLKHEESPYQLYGIAIIELIFEKKFKPTLIRYISSNTGTKELHFDKSTNVK